MTNREIRNTMNCLVLMCKDLNDIHDNYDIDTITENNYKQSMIDAINSFNHSQSIWKAILMKTKTGWKVIYE